jgi:hypothetical protein
MALHIFIHVVFEFKEECHPRVKIFENACMDLL